MSHSDVFVIGAGPAGLTAAYLLTKQGISTTVIEADPHYVGGISRTASYKGFLFDIGGHRFFSKSKEVEDLWNEILPDDFISRPRMSRIYYNGKYFSYPLKAFEALTNLGADRERACACCPSCTSRPSRTRSPSRFHEWVANQFGERLFSIFFKTYTEKVWGMSCDEISADWAAQRIKGLACGRRCRNALRNSTRAGQEGPGHHGQRRGHQDADRHLPVSAQGPRHDVGGRRPQGARARRRDPHGHHARQPALGQDQRAVDHHRQDGARREPRPSPPATSSPRRRSASCLPASSRQPDCKAAADKLRYRDFITVALIVEKPDLFPDNWIYIHEPAVKVGRIQNFRSWSPEMVPNPNSVLPRPRILLLRGRRPVERHRRRADRPRQEGAGADRPGRLERHQGRLRGAPEEGLSGLRRRLQGQRRDDPRRARRRNSRRCIWSAATACTSTTTRTTP